MISKKTLALLLLIGFGAALAYAINNFPQQGRIATLKPVSPQQPHTPKHGERLSGPRIASLREHRPDYGGCRADLFRPLFERPPAPPAPKPKPRPKTKKPPLPAPEPPIATQPEPLKEPTIARKLADFTYLGQVNEGAGTSVFLKERGHIFIVKTGDIFGGKKEFRLARVTEKEISIITEEYAEPIRIPLQEKQPLKMSMAPETSATDTRHLRPRRR